MPEEKGGRAPELSKRRNIVVIADEAHRSQYNLIDGLARNSARLAPEPVVHRLDSFAAQLSRASPSALRCLCRSAPAFLPFTGTPIENTDANTRAVFGDLPSQALRECRRRFL